MNQIGIAVIDNMVDIETGMSFQMARVFIQAVDQAVHVTWQPVISENRRPGQTKLHGWPDPPWVHALNIRQGLDQRVGNGVHAVPAFFDEITDDPYIHQTSLLGNLMTLEFTLVKPSPKYSGAAARAARKSA